MFPIVKSRVGALKLHILGALLLSWAMIFWNNWVIKKICSHLAQKMFLAKISINEPPDLNFQIFSGALMQNVYQTDKQWRRKLSKWTVVGLNGVSSPSVINLVMLVSDGKLEIVPIPGDYLIKYFPTCFFTLSGYPRVRDSIPPLCLKTWLSGRSNPCEGFWVDDSAFVVRRCAFYELNGCTNCWVWSL